MHLYRCLLQFHKVKSTWLLIILMSTLDNHDIHENPNLRVLELVLL
jgi:hypothetical protein